MPRLYEERNDDQEAFLSVRVFDDGEEEFGVPYSRTSTYRKKYAEKYKTIKQQEREKERQIKAEYARNARFDMLASNAAHIAEKKLLEVVEYEVYIESVKVMCAFYIKVPDTPIVVLEIPDHEKYERDYYATELAKQICKTIRGKNES